MTEVAPHPQPHSKPDWSRVSEALRRFLLRRGVSPADADDVLQEAMLRVLAGIDRLRSPAAFDAFVFQTTRNVLVDHLRRNQRFTSLDATDSHPGGPESGDAAGPQSVLDADRDALAAQAVLTRWLDNEIEHLPEPVRSTIRRTEIEGWSQRAVADADGVTISAIKSRVQRGRRELKRRLQACCEVRLDARRRVTDLSVRSPGSCSCRRTSPSGARSLRHNPRQR